MRNTLHPTPQQVTIPAALPKSDCDDNGLKQRQCFAIVKTLKIRLNCQGISENAFTIGHSLQHGLKPHNATRTCLNRCVNRYTSKAIAVSIVSTQIYQRQRYIPVSLINRFMNDANVTQMRQDAQFGYMLMVIVNRLNRKTENLTQTHHR